MVWEGWTAVEVPGGWLQLSEQLPMQSGMVEEWSRPSTSRRCECSQGVRAQKLEAALLAMADFLEVDVLPVFH